MRAIPALRAILCAAVIVCAFAIDGVPARSAEALQPNHVTVYYFHGNFRCANCHNMEDWTKEAIDENFKDDLKSGRLDLRIINLDTKGNEHFALEYQLFTKSVVLALVRDGREIKFTNLTKVWDLLKNRKNFKAYVKEEISRYLEELK